MDAINLTESRYLHEAELFHITDSSVEDKSRDFSSADEALKAMEATPPLHELLLPLIEKVKDGLAGMGKIVGARTAQKDINPGLLAAAISVKERCDKEVVLPLEEMNQITASRLKELKDMYKSQLSQVSALQETIALLKDRSNTTSEKMEVAESNATLLAQRSRALLQASQDLRPTVTDAELEYFQLLKRVKAKCEKWEENIRELQQASTSLCSAIDAGQASIDLDLSPQEVDNCRSLLHGQEEALRMSGNSVKCTQGTLKALVAATGLSSNGDESTSGTGTPRVGQ